MKNCSDFKNRLHLLWVSWKFRITTLWEKCRSILLPALIVIIFAFLRFVSYSGPSWSFGFIGPLMFIRFLSQELFDSGILLELILLSGAFFTSMLIPGVRKLHRFLTRPVLCALLVLPVSAGMIVLNDAAIELSFERKLAQAEQLIEEADEIFYFNLSTHQHATKDFTRPEILHCCGHSHDMILIDYDDHSVTILRDLTNSAYLKVDRFRLRETDKPPGNNNIQINVPLSAPGAQLLSYYPDKENSHRTTSIALAMADGTVYALTDLTDSNGYVRFLDLRGPVADQTTCPYGESS